uniref:Lipoprotein n=2 Tax=Pseudomonas khorasanensis TaxID=2745508 RepID=A0A923F1Z5_9PSED
MTSLYPLFKSAVLGCCFIGAAGCASSQPNTFTFTADMPPDFRYEAIAVYVPAQGETCTVPDGRGTGVGYNRKWRENYQPDSEIALRRTVGGCPLVISRIELDIYAIYGKDWSDFGADSARVFIRDDVKEQYKSVFNEAGESTFFGECQQLFRTSGKPRILRKLLDCKTIDAQGELKRGKPSAAYTPDQLAGKKVRMHIKLASEEVPAFKDTWVRVQNGWKRCMGKNFEDQDAYCFGNYKDFSGFQMPGGKQCTIYPGCTE